MDLQTSLPDPWDSPQAVLPSFEVTSLASHPTAVLLPVHNVSLNKVSCSPGWREVCVETPIFCLAGQEHNGESHIPLLTCTFSRVLPMCLSCFPYCADLH